MESCWEFDEEMANDCGENFWRLQNPHLCEERQVFLSAIKMIRQHKVSCMHAMIGSAMF
jgi:hypothetical protein